MSPMTTDTWSGYPEYGTTATAIDRLRSEQYPQLDEQKHVYLDYTGSGLPAQAQIKAQSERMVSMVAGNPHSVSPASNTSNNLMAATRRRILEFVNASPEEYAVIFTANATAAARLVGEAYPFTRQSKLILTTDNHNSINGLRCFAERGRSKTTYIPLNAEDMRIDTGVVEKMLSKTSRCWPCRRTCRGLFAFPAQSNFSGVQHPLSWIETAQEHGYDVLLDAAAYLASAPLDLRRVHPDFVIVSWYKILGLPTGVGSLVAKWSSLAKLQRPWFSGGTVSGVMVGQHWHAMGEGEAKFEDGTVNFLSIPDVLYGLDWFGRLDWEELTSRLRYLTGWLLKRLGAIKHGNGVHLVKLYGPLSSQNRGATVAFNLADRNAVFFDERLVGVEAAAAKISIRVGCFCNPGANESAHRVHHKDLTTLAKTNKENFEEVHESLGRPLAGAIRVSLGIASNLADVEAFLEFIESTYKDRVVTRARDPGKAIYEV